MKSGIVKKYFSGEGPGRGFGFIKVEGGKDVFFHIKNRKNVNAEAGEPELSFIIAKCNVRDPKEGDRIMFDVVQGKKGLMAEPWCFAEDWERAMEEIASQKTETIASDPTPQHGDKTMRKESGGRKNPYERHHNRIKDNTDGEKDWRKDL